MNKNVGIGSNIRRKVATIRRRDANMRRRGVSFNTPTKGSKLISLVREIRGMSLEK